MRRHIRGVVGHYRGEIRTWDVINEAVAEDEALRDNWLFPQVVGPAYIERAFRFAHRADPQATLAYNDFGIEVRNPKSDGVYRLLGDLIDRGVSVDQLGIQGHMNINAAVPSVTDLVANMTRFADLGLELEITELDVALPQGAPVTPDARPPGGDLRRPGRGLPAGRGLSHADRLGRERQPHLARRHQSPALRQRLSAQAGLGCVDDGASLGGRGDLADRRSCSLAHESGWRVRDSQDDSIARTATLRQSRSAAPRADGSRLRT